MSLSPDDTHWIPVRGMRVELRSDGVHRKLEVAAIAPPNPAAAAESAPSESRRLPLPGLLTRKR